MSTSSDAALDHGFQTGLYVLMGLLVVGALTAVTMIRSERAPRTQPTRVEADRPVALEEAA